MIQEGGGKATLKTVQGEDLTASMSSGKVHAHRREKWHGDRHHCDVFQSNGVIHVIDFILMPN
jgi:uncharacterized surface protein with fasciclin (FAS1) repeats